MAYADIFLCKVKTLSKFKNRLFLFARGPYFQSSRFASFFKLISFRWTLQYRQAETDDSLPRWPLRYWQPESRLNMNIY